LASPLGRMTLGYCRECAYVRNLAFDPAIMVYDTTMDTNLHHSAAFRRFSTELAKGLTERHALKGKTILDIGCGQGEFLRELCKRAHATGIGYDPMYAGPEGPDPAGATFHSARAPMEALPEFDYVTSRHWFEHEDDPYGFLVALRERAGDREVSGYIEVPDAGYDLATAGWEVIYPHVSYFDASALAAIAERAGWHVTAEGTWFGGMFRYLNFSTVEAAKPDRVAYRTTARDRQLRAIEGFEGRQRSELDRWQATIKELSDSGANPVLWGAGSRGVQFLTQVDPDGRLAAVVDVNPRKWGRYLPVSAHRVDPPESLRDLRPQTVIITNPSYTLEIAAALANLDVQAQLLPA